MPRWDAEVYLKFGKERTQPSIDLAHRIDLDHPTQVIDLGCGPGNSTAVLRERWPKANIVGLDGSAEMIQAARQTYPDNEWIVGDAAEWKASRPLDVIFSNALLHWLPDHAAVCVHWLQQLAPGGALAVQLPAHYDSPAHREIFEVSKDPAWNSQMESVRAMFTLQPPSFYYDVLHAAARVDLWETSYFHAVDGIQSVLEWFRGTGLRPFLQKLASDEDRARFEQMLLSRYEKLYQRRPQGKILFPFRRIFFVAYR